MSERYETLYKQLGYRFSDAELLHLALSHRSAGRQNNERLEFLGDSILGFVIAEYLYDALPQAQEGELSRLRASLVQKMTLAAIARELGLGQFLVLGAGEKKSGGKKRESILADCLEAIIAAIYRDGGLDACRQSIRRWFGQRLQQLEQEDAGKDAKTRLQEYAQARRLDLPVYEVREVSGQDHAQRFTVLCQLPALGHQAQGEGSNRREAEQNAAEHILKQLSE